MCLYLTRELQNKWSKYYLTYHIDILYKQQYCRLTIVNIGKVEIEILYSLDLNLVTCYPHPLIQHMKTLVCVYGFLKIKYSLYIIDNDLFQRYLFFVDYNLVLISKHPCCFGN